jgi:hypothetical protein
MSPRDDGTAVTESCKGLCVETRESKMRGRQRSWWMRQGVMMAWAGCAGLLGCGTPCGDSPLIPVGETPGTIAAADLNGDGKTDLAVANEGSSDVTVLLNQGGGVFADGVSYDVSVRPRFLTTADLNGDGRIDLVVGHVAENLVSVLLNKGDGTFAPAVDYVAAPGDPHGAASVSVVAAADLDGDGHPDLATIVGEGIRVLHNHGDGTFSDVGGYPVVRAPTWIAAADMNGDGKPDLAVSGVAESGGKVSVLLNHGDGTFAPSVDYDAGLQPTSLVAADLDGDGKPDLAMADNFAASLFVLHNLGDGTFGPDIRYVTGTGLLSVVATDLNGDGKPDLAATTDDIAARIGDDGKVKVRFNQGDGTFAAPVEHHAGHSPVSLVAADLDGNGKPDIAVAHVEDHAVTVLLDGCLR